MATLNYQRVDLGFRDRRLGNLKTLALRSALKDR